MDLGQPMKRREGANLTGAGGCFTGKNEGVARRLTGKEETGNRFVFALIPMTVAVEGNKALCLSLLLCHKDPCLQRLAEEACREGDIAQEFIAKARRLRHKAAVW